MRRRNTQTLVTDRLDPHTIATLRQLIKLHGANQLIKGIDDIVREDNARWKEERARHVAAMEGKSWGGEGKYTLDPETGEKRYVHRIDQDKHDRR